MNSENPNGSFATRNAELAKENERLRKWIARLENMTACAGCGKMYPKYTMVCVIGDVASSPELACLDCAEGGV